MKKPIQWPVRLASGALVVTVLAGIAAAAGTQGSQSDPLVTLSYLNNKATPVVLSQVDAKITQRQAELKNQLAVVVDGYVKAVEDKLRAGGGTGTGGALSGAASYTVVTLKAGQTVTAGAACEFLLRSGTAVCVSASAPGLVDMTGGTTLTQGGGLVANHLYIATVDGRGVKATTAATLLVRGSYTVN